jgi:hypothetical protein
MKTPLTSLIATAALALCASAAHANNLVVQGDTVFDRDTELTWKRCSVGMRWAADQNRCVGVKRTFTFDDAQQIKAEGGWRVPTFDELKTLIEKRPEDQRKINTNAFPDMEGDTVTWYWSITPNGASHGWSVYFRNGDASGYSRSTTLAVRLVRGGQ